MGHRRQKRLVFALPVKLWMVDSNGNPQVENACTLDVSLNGLRLFSRALDRPRQEVVVAYLRKKARYRVVWVGEKGSPTEGIAGLICLEPEKGLFADFTSEAGYIDDYVPDHVPPARTQANSAAKTNPAKAPIIRYECEGSAELRVAENSTRTWTPLTHLWLQGCYLACLSPPELNKIVHLRMFVDGHDIKATGIVDSRDPGMGMSVAFGLIAADDRVALERVVAKLAKRAPIATPPAEPAHPSVERRTPNLTELLADWFAHHDALTREQYQQFVQQTQQSLVIR